MLDLNKFLFCLLISCFAVSSSAQGNSDEDDSGLLNTEIRLDLDEESDADYEADLYEACADEAFAATEDKNEFQRYIKACIAQAKDIESVEAE